MHDFYSDTQTRPTRAMREAILDAPVGDERHFDDPSTNALCERVADMLGMEAAMFLPSGTMCNQIAIAVHCSPGDEVICTRESHILFAESGASAALSGVMHHPIDAERGMMTPDQVVGAIRPPSSHAPRSRLLCAEQTVNLAGGAIWPVQDDMPETAPAAVELLTNEEHETAPAEDDAPEAAQRDESTEDTAATRNSAGAVGADEEAVETTPAMEAAVEDDGPAGLRVTEAELEAIREEAAEEALSSAEAAEAEKSDDQRDQERNDRLRILGAAAAGLAAAAILPELGARFIGQQGDRVILQEGERLIVRKDESARLLTEGATARVEELAEGRSQVIVDRPDGAQIVTLRGPGGELLRRVRRLPNGDEVVLFDERDRSTQEAASDLAALDAALPFVPPADRPTTSLSGATAEDILRALRAEPVRPAERVYSLNEVRLSERLRWQVPSLELDAVTFESGSADLRADQIEVLDAMGVALREVISERPDEVFLIEGHADATGGALLNLTLSDRRAETVALALTSVFDVPPENIVTQGYGSQDLKVPTSGPSRENRRVELRRITPLLQ